MKIDGSLARNTDIDVSKFWGSLGELGEGNGDFVAALCDRHNTFASFSEDDFHFSWQAQHFGRVYHHFA